jgi:transcriptional regulator with XRE-family HTH domain
MAYVTDTELSWLRLAREWRGFSQKELARRARTKQAQVSRFESGRSEPTLAVARRLADALGVDVNLLFPTNGTDPRDFLGTYFEPSSNGQKKRRRKTQP